MSIPYGKMKKSPEQNVQCYLASVEAYIDEAKGEIYNKKAKNRYPKYMTRMLDIIGGKFK